MKQNNTNFIRLYLKEIKNSLICSNNIKKVFTKEIQQQITEMEKDTPISSIDILYEKIGFPNEIARGFETREDVEQLKKKAKKYTRTKIVLCVGLFLAVMIAVISIIALTQADSYHVIITSK